MQNNTTSVEKNLAISSKMTSTLPHEPSNSIFRNLLRKYTCQNTIVDAVLDYPDAFFMTWAMGDPLLRVWKQMVLSWDPL